jgi:glycosyltransferase involved in cell wall biosynthesis
MSLQNIARNFYLKAAINVLNQGICDIVHVQGNKMKIAYVTINIDTRIINGGVGNKIQGQVSIWESMGHSVNLFVLTPGHVSLPFARQFTFNNSSKTFLQKFFVREISRSIKLVKLISAVRAYRPDVIYFRFGLFTYPLQDLLKIAPTILEVNSNDLDEYRYRGTFFYLLNRITRDILFSRCTGWVATSHELANFEENHRHKKPVCVISNGIDLEKYVPLQPARHQAPSLSLVGSPGMNWHGVDKLLPLAEKYPELTINIIGYRDEDFEVPIPSNVRLHGYLERDNLKKILADTDVVFGTLALHRKNMKEASPLKVREALGYGIPVILAYEDTDLMDMQSDYFLFLPNSENNIAENAKLIRDFSFRVIGMRVDRALIANRIDQHIKEEKRLAFFVDMIRFSGS